MAVTILGQNIRVVRPARSAYHCVYKNERPAPKVNKRSRVIKEHTGKVIACCVMMKSGGIRSVHCPSNHLQVCEEMVTDIDNVEKIGWQLENGNYVWR